jgi:Ca-activated chloride channel homolog
MKVYHQLLFRVAITAGIALAGAMHGSAQDLKLQRLAADEPVVVRTNLVSLKVSVTDVYGRAVSGLDQSAFKIFDDKVPQTISFFSDADAPASIAVVFDTSGSMNGLKLARAKEALANFIQTGHQRDEYFLIDFDSQARLLLDRTRDGDSLYRKLTYVQPHGTTALYDAVYLGIERVMSGAFQKRAILLISDGEDNNSRYNLNEVRRSLRESDATIYAIGVDENYLPRKGGPNGRETLEQLASQSGGKAFFPGSASEMFEAFDRIGLELRHLYSIGYRPSDLALSGNWHRLKIKIDPPPGSPRLFVRSREGYYALANIN